MYLYLLRKFCICNCIYYDFFLNNCSSIYFKKKLCIYYIFCEYRAQLCLLPLYLIISIPQNQTKPNPTPGY